MTTETTTYKGAEITAYNTMGRWSWEYIRTHEDGSHSFSYSCIHEEYRESWKAIKAAKNLIDESDRINQHPRVDTVVS